MNPNPMDLYQQPGRKPKELWMVLGKGRNLPTEEQPKPRLRTVCQVYLTKANALGAFAQAQDWAVRAKDPEAGPETVQLFKAELDWEEVPA